MRAAVTALLTAALVVGGAAAPQLPERLDQTGLYLPGTLTVDPRNRPFTPQYPLWTDGAAKSRWLRLPAGARIDAHDPDRWEFPVGTRFWKEFTFAGRRVETRLVWRSREDVWTYATYVWNDAQTEATLAPAEGIVGAAEIAPGRRHAIPSREDCRACHEPESAPVLGFSALQLSTDRDPLAPHAEPLREGMLTVQTLLDEQRLERPASILARAPRIPGDPRTRAVLGYLTANCGHCHNDASTVATVAFPLRVPAYASPADVDRIVAALRAHRTRWDLPHHAPGTTTVLRPGAPNLSALFVRMRSRRPSSQMPPIGSVVEDPAALDLIGSWIADLRGE